MAKKFFEVQAALLFDTRPPLDIGMYFEWFVAWAKDKGLPGSFQTLKGATDANNLGIAGAGMHAMIHFSDEPCAADEFSLPLRAPILKNKNFDFKAAIKEHRASVVITVGDGEVPMSAENLELMAQAGMNRPPSDPMLKLAFLQALMQSLATLTRPTMVSFCPSQSLLCPQELAAVSEMPLPFPILFHPFPFSNGKNEDGMPRIGMAAIHAPLLIGTELELENIPSDMPIATRINLLATLIQKKRSGDLPLDDGDRLQPDGTYNLTVRHEPGSKDGGPLRVVVTFNDHAARSTPQDQKGQQAFQERIARLKTRGTHDSSLCMPETPPGSSSSESPDDLLARVKDTISPEGHGTVRSGFLGGPIKLVAFASLLGLFFVLGPSEDVAEMATSQVTSISGLMKTLSGGEVISSGTVEVSNTDMVRQFESSVREGSSP